VAEPDHHPSTEAEPAVDADGRPESPAEAAVEKHKKKQLTYFGLALGAVGVVVAIFTLRRSSSSSSSSTLPTFSGAGTGLVAGSGSAGDASSGGSNTDAGLAALQAQLATDQQQNAAAQAGLASALARLASELHATGGGNRGDQARTLAKVNAADYARVLPSGAQVEVIGSDTAKGKYTGAQLALGAPLYAWVKGKWVQGINPKTAAAGTIFGTTKQFDPYVVQPGQKAPTASAPKLPQVTNPIIVAK
jgi:hypothetical protein